jgi:membrane fusion protein (multidrug efflux system)
MVDGMATGNSGWKGLLSWRALLPLLGLLLTVGWAVQHWMGDAHYVYSDDAYVQGKITYVSSTVAGRLIALNVNEGDPVQFGEILATVDRTGEAYQRPHNTRKNLKAFQHLKRDTARLEVLKTREVDERDHYERAAGLSGSGFIAPQRLEDLKTAWQKTRVAIRETRALILSEKQALEVSEVHPRNRTVFAPISGQVAQRLVNLGETVRADQPIVSLINLGHPDNIWLDVFVRETQVWKIKPGQKVRIHVDAWPKDTFTGRVLEFIPAASQAFSLLPTQNAAGTFVKVVQRIPVRVVFDDLKGRTLLPGMSAEVWIDRHTPIPTKNEMKRT